MNYELILRAVLHVLPLLLVSCKPWTSLYMDGTASNFFLVICPHEAGTWDLDNTLGVDFWTIKILFKTYLMRGENLF